MGQAAAAAGRVSTGVRSEESATGTPIPPPAINLLPLSVSVSSVAPCPRHIHINTTSPYASICAHSNPADPTPTALGAPPPAAAHLRPQHVCLRLQPYHLLRVTVLQLPDAALVVDQQRQALHPLRLQRLHVMLQLRRLLPQPQHLSRRRGHGRRRGLAHSWAAGTTCAPCCMLRAQDQPASRAPAGQPRRRGRGSKELLLQQGRAGGLPVAVSIKAAEVEHRVVSAGQGEPCHRQLLLRRPPGRGGKRGRTAQCRQLLQPRGWGACLECPHQPLHVRCKVKPGGQGGLAAQHTRRGRDGRQRRRQALGSCWLLQLPSHLLQPLSQLDPGGGGGAGAAGSRGRGRACRHHQTKTSVLVHSAPQGRRSRAQHGAWQLSTVGRIRNQLWLTCAATSLALPGREGLERHRGRGGVARGAGVQGVVAEGAGGAGALGSS